MTFETKYITFHVIHVKASSDSRCSKTVLMNVTIKSVYSTLVREIHAQRCGEDIVKHKLLHLLTRTKSG